ncbi:DUF4153 domain-containing protein [Streptosporangium sp. NPDC048047]|uniref:DUF4153 domain-containing protein n=1 Tax=Streptosporangium sp. NPDC048047 TaxID=3155748 RepID=UPI00342F8523
MLRLRPLDFLGRIKVKLGLVILLAVVVAFVVNEVGINSGYSRDVRVAVAAVLALVIMQLLARGMTKPLREMAAAAQTIAKGRYGLRVTATSRDEVGELARAFNAMAADLAEVDRQRRALVADVSHELRTPITALRAVLENVVDGVSAPDQATLETALAQTERLGRLVTQLLDLSRLESGARLIELENVGLRPLCEQALREAVLARDGVAARCEVPEGLGVRADPDLLAQVLANLLDNAVRHSPDGGAVVLAAAPEGGGVRLRVTDEGPGIPEAERARVFERFSRLDAGRTADDGGAGLGLAITKEIVELHGGSIRVEDGPGCRVAVDLPGRTAGDAAPPAMPPVPVRPPPVPAPSGPDVPEPSRWEAPAPCERRMTFTVPARPSGAPAPAPSTRGNAVEPSPAPPGTTAEYVVPPVLPRPELPPTPRWALPACAAVGLLAAVALPGSAMSLGFVLVAAAMGAAALPAVRRRVTPWSAVLGLIAYGLVAVAAFRDADWLAGPLLPAGFLLAALALSGAGRGWAGVLRGGASVVLGLLPVPWFLAAPVRPARGLPLRRRVVPVLAGTALSAVLVAVFGALFASADAVFAEAVARVFSVRDLLGAGALPLRILLFGVFAAVTASAVLAGLRPVAEPEVPGARLAVSRGVWVLPLVALDLLFGVFVAMQLTVLFGSSRWLVSATGLTYAQYARSGFFQLAAVSVFVLAIVAVASGAIRLRGGERWLMAGLLGPLCALTMVVLVSALHRLDLYVGAYGFTRLRASVEAAIWWLGAVFALVLVAGAVRLVRRRAVRWLPRTLVAMTGAALLVFAVWNPDLRVAETQIAVRGPDRIDHRYLGGLGAEAVPALDRLPEPVRSCVLRNVTERNDLAAPDPWNGWNLARERAREVLARHPVRASSDCRTR